MYILTSQEKRGDTRHANASVAKLDGIYTYVYVQYVKEEKNMWVYMCEGSEKMWPRLR